MTAERGDGPSTAEEWIDYLRETEGDEWVEERRGLIDVQLRRLGYLPANTTDDG